MRPGGITLAVATKLVRRLFQRTGQSFAFGSGIKRRCLIHLFHERQTDVHPAFGNGHPGGGGQRANTRLSILAKQRGQLRLGKNGGHLRRQGDEKRLFAFIKLTQLTLLHHQHTQQLTPLDNRDAKKSAEAILFDGRNIFKAGMFLRIGKVDRLRKAPDQANEAFVKRERNGTPARFFQPASGHKVITSSVVIGQVNRTNFRFHRFADIGDQDIQRLV